MWKDGSSLKKTMIAAEQTWLSRNDRAAKSRQRDGGDSNSSGKNLDLFQRLWQDSSNICDNTVAERTWLGRSVSNINGSFETSATVEVRTWLTVPGGIGGREAKALSRQQRRRQSKLGLEETEGRQRNDSKKAATATSPAQIWIRGRGCGKTAVTAVTTWLCSELGLVLASATAMAAAKRQQQWKTELGLHYMAAVVAERWQQLEDNNNGSEANLA